MIEFSALKSHLFILLDPINRMTTNSPQEETPSLQHEKVKTFLLISLSFPYNNTVYMCVILYLPVTVIFYPPMTYGFNTYFLNVHCQNNYLDILWRRQWPICSWILTTPHLVSTSIFYGNRPYASTYRSKQRKFVI